MVPKLPPGLLCRVCGIVLIGVPTLPLDILAATEDFRWSQISVVSGSHMPVCLALSYHIPVRSWILDLEAALMHISGCLCKFGTFVMMCRIPQDLVRPFAKKM